MSHNSEWATAGILGCCCTKHNGEMGQRVPSIPGRSFFCAFSFLAESKNPVPSTLYQNLLVGKRGKPTHTKGYKSARAKCHFAQVSLHLKGDSPLS